MTAPILAFTEYTKLFLLETDPSKNGLGVVLSQKQADGQYHPVTYGSWALTPNKKNYHSTKLEFLALKLAVTEHFKECLPYQPFLVKTDNNPLTYIMMTPSLDATSHWWVSALAWFNFELEYQKGHNNTGRCPQLSYHLTGPRHGEINPQWSNTGISALGKVHDPAIVEGDCCLEQEVRVTAGSMLVQMHVTDWAVAQKEDPMLSAVLDWLKAQKKTDLKALLTEDTSSEEGQLILRNWQNFIIHQGSLYLHSTPKGETEYLLLLIVSKTHCVTALNGCHTNAGHQGHHHTLSLLQDRSVLVAGNG